MKIEDLTSESWSMVHWRGQDPPKPCTIDGLIVDITSKANHVGLLGEVE